MKEKLMLLMATVILSCPSFASEITDVSIIEKDLFGIEYKDENISKRLSRIEENIFGEIKTGTNAIRIKNITEASGISLTPKQTAEEKRIIAADYQKEDNSVTYPIIDMMENEVFNKNFHGENVYKRVARLEEKTFGKAFEGDLSTRTDKLKASILAVKPNTLAYEDSYNYENDYSHYNNDSLFSKTNTEPLFSRNYTTGGAANLYQENQNDFEYALTSAENMILGKTNKNNTNSERLNKLEKKVFKKTFSGDKITRLERVVSAAQAQKTGHIYKESKMDKYLSTGIQVGSILLMILAMIL